MTVGMRRVLGVLGLAASILAGCNGELVTGSTDGGADASASGSSSGSGRGSGSSSSGSSSSGGLGGSSSSGGFGSSSSSGSSGGGFGSTSSSGSSSSSSGASSSSSGSGSSSGGDSGSDASADATTPDAAIDAAPPVYFGAGCTAGTVYSDPFTLDPILSGNWTQVAGTYTWNSLDHTVTLNGVPARTRRCGSACVQTGRRTPCPGP
jgi:hypothetical protein